MGILMAGIGAALGAMLRYLVVYFAPAKGILTGVFWVNVLGAFFMGVLLANHALNVYNGLLSTGILGGLTTFSTMMTQSAQGTRQHQFLYLAVQMLAGWVAFVLGMQF